MAKITLPEVSQVDYGSVNTLLQKAAEQNQKNVEGLGNAFTGLAEDVQKGNLAALEQSMMQAKTVNEFNNPEFQQGLQNQLAGYGRSIDKTAVNKLLDSRPVTLAEQQSKLLAQEQQEAAYQGEKNAALVHQLQSAGRQEEANALLNSAGFNSPETLINLQKLRQGDANLASTLAGTANTQFNTYAAGQKLPVEITSAQQALEAAKFKLENDKTLAPLQREALQMQINEGSMKLQTMYAAYNDEYGGGTSGSGGGANFGMTQTGTTGKPGSNAAKYMPVIYDQYRRNGLSDVQARAMVAEHGRENDFNPAYMFGTHTDAGANRNTNIGIMSWQGGRDKQLIQFMQQRGVWDGKGKMPQTEAALRAQVDFAVHEMKTGKAYERTRREFLANPSVSQQQAGVVLGDNFIRWDRRGKYLGKNLSKHLSKRDNYYNMVGSNSAQSQAQQLANARDRANGRQGDPNRNIKQEARLVGGMDASTQYTKADAVGNRLLEAGKSQGTGSMNKTLAPDKNRYLTTGKATPQDVMAMLDLNPEAISKMSGSQQKAVKERIKETHQLMQESTLNRFNKSDKIENLNEELNNWTMQHHKTSGLFTPAGWDAEKYEAAKVISSTILQVKNHKSKVVEALGDKGKVLNEVNLDMLPDAFWLDVAPKIMKGIEGKLSENKGYNPIKNVNPWFVYGATREETVKAIASAAKQYQLEERRQMEADVNKIISSQRDKLNKDWDGIAKKNRSVLGI